MRFPVSALAALFVIVGLGCQNSTAPAPHAMAPTGRAVVISGGNGGGTTVFLPSSDADDPVMLSTSGEPTCSDCKAAAVKYFRTGVLDPKCPHCGATRTAVTGTPPNYGHN